MCKVKYGVQLNNEMDLQNMVIAIILRQTQDYKEQDILKLAIRYSNQSPMIIDKSALKRVTREMLDLLYRFGKIDCMDGVYSPIPVCKLRN